LRPPADGPKARAFSAAVCVAAILVSWPALAHRVRCPVCGQEFETDETSVCPNDGTDLESEGRPVEVPAEDADAGVGDEEAATDVATPKYKRHDVGGERQRVDDDSQTYSDRERRIGEERRGQAAAVTQKRQREHERALFEAEDERLRNDFEERRAALEEKRKRSVSADWWSGRERLRRERKSLWERAAPLTAVGVRLSWMGEDRQPGPLTGAEIDINLLKTRLRVGLSSFLGIRQLADRGELAFLEHVSVGVQIPWRWSPYLLARVGLGVLAGERFGEDLNHLVLSAGLETGIDCHVTDAIVVTPVAGWARYVIDDAYWDTVTLRLGVGF
jgi:hypothetical protein